MVEPQATFSWWQWHFHPDVVLGVLVLQGLYLLGIGPLRKRFHLAPSVEPRQLVFFSLGLLVLYVALTSSLHELADHFLFSAHMVQHLLLIFVTSPLLIWGTPPWLLRPLVRPHLVQATCRFFTHPVVAFILFDAVLASWHLPLLYDLALRSHGVHVLQHLTFLSTSVIMWWPVLGTLPELPRASYPVQMVYLFFLSLPMGFVGAAITFSRRVLYPWYGEVPRLWGLSPVVDQQVAGLIMKVPGSLIFLGAFVVMFFAWYNQEGRGEEEKGQEQEPSGEPWPGASSASRR